MVNYTGQKTNVSFAWNNFMNSEVILDYKFENNFCFPLSRLVFDRTHIHLAPLRCKIYFQQCTCADISVF